jgi:hypothetical protein
MAKNDKNSSAASLRHNRSVIGCSEKSISKLKIRALLTDPQALLLFEVMPQNGPNTESKQKKSTKPIQRPRYEDEQPRQPKKSPHNNKVNLSFIISSI